MKNSHRKVEVSRPVRQWRRMDLHLHTPGSGDYQEPTITYLDILRQADLRGLDIIAFTDHNSVAGYAGLKKQIEQLELLERLNRIEADEKRRLEEYRRLLDKILLLPGFEFTATFGFHVLAIFPPNTPVNYLEHLLLTLNVPKESLLNGSASVGATTDVLTAYKVIHDAGGIVIAAHANSGNGVMMRGLDFGGQTRVAYTQDPHLHTLEVTDLEKRGRYATSRFFDGSKPEYPRPMRCIQGSDAHRLQRDPANAKSLGIGDRVTEILLASLTFEEVATVLKGSDFSLTRPYRGKAQPVDFVQAAREEGESIVQSFYPSMTQRGGHLGRVLEDICAMANTNGGTIYVGVTANPKEKPIGVRDLDAAIGRLEQEITGRITPQPDVQIDYLPSQGQSVVRISIHPGQEPPYAIDDNHFFVRYETETSLAVRDEIVRLVEKGLRLKSDDPLVQLIQQMEQPAPAGATPTPSAAKPTKPQTPPIAPPSTGVEIIHSEKRNGIIYHTVHDLRNGNLIQNVNLKSARKLWHYAITQAEAGGPPLEQLKWQNSQALVGKRQKEGHTWYDLALRQDDQIHIYYGVTDNGLNESWQELIENAQ